MRHVCSVSSAVKAARIEKRCSHPRAVVTVDSVSCPDCGMSLVWLEGDAR